MERSKKMLGLGIAVVIALLAVTFFMADNLTTTTNAAEGGPEMVLAVKTGAECDGSTCTVAEGAAFTLSVVIVTPPSQGYILAQAYVLFGSDLVYKPSDLPLDEFSWPECTPASLAVRDQLDDVSVLSGCITGILVRPVSNYSGNLLNFAMNCSAGPSSTEVELLEAGNPVALTNGALFKDEADAEIIPKVSNLTINCGDVGGGDPTDTPEGPDATPTATPDESADTPTATPDVPVDTPTNTPVVPTATPSDQPCGDVDGDGEVTSLDSLFILWLIADLIEDTPKFGDVNGDRIVSAIDAALVLQIVAGLHTC